MDFSQSKIIWAEDNTVKCDRVIFRKEFGLEKPPKSAMLGVCGYDSVSVYVNGTPVALGAIGATEYDIGKYLCKGANVLGFECLYYGERANMYEPRGNSGLLVKCDALGIYSDSGFAAFRPYTQDAGEPHPSGKFRGFDVYTDGGRGELGNVFEADYGSTLFSAAVEYGEGGETENAPPVNCEYEGETRLKKFVKTTEGVTNTFVYDLGEEKIFYPVLELAGMGTEKVEVKSNRYVSYGAWGDESTYFAARGIYVCRNGIQKYVHPAPLYGSKLVIVAPATVTVRSVDVRTVSYPVKRVLEISYDELAEKIADKCDNTMRACMDGGILDNTDRDRGCDLFALSNFARAAVLTYDDKILPLLKHAILSALPQSADTVKNNALSPFADENPLSSLLFCSRLGAVAAYYMRSGDCELVKSIYDKLCAYVLGWEFGFDGLVTRADGKYADAGFNADCELAETCLYYSAAEFLVSLSDAAVNYEYEGELRRRMELIEGYFESRYARDGFYSSGEVCDERANALAVLSHLAADDGAKVCVSLAACHNASPAYEGFVTEALGMAGRQAEAKRRFSRRAREFAESDSTVLGEYFARRGSACSSLPLSLLPALVSGVLGVRYNGDRSIATGLDAELGDYKADVPMGDASVRVTVKRGTANIENRTSLSATAVMRDSVVKLEKDKIKLDL